MPVKGTHASSDANWISQTTRHGYYGKVDFLFVVQEEADPAYALLRQMQADGRLPKEGLRVLVAGLTKNTSQKLHNMIYAIERVSEASEFVLMLDDDMLLHPGASGAVTGLAKELVEPTVLAASGFSCDVPALPTVVCHTSCLFRLVMDLSISLGTADAAWGGCCMMRRADLLESVPGGVMSHWKNYGYSDDWIITQVAKRTGKRIINPPWALFLNLVDINTFKRLYNFMQRQLFVTDTYVQPANQEEDLPGDCCGIDPHRVESIVLPHVMLVIGFVFCLGMVLLPLQLGLLVHDLIDDGLGGDDLARRLLLHRVDRMLLIAIPLLGIPGVTIGGISAVRAQAALITHLSPESGEALRESGSWSVWRFPLSFILFNIMSVGWTFQGFYGQSVRRLVGRQVHQAAGLGAQCRDAAEERGYSDLLLEAFAGLVGERHRWSII